MAQVTQVRVLEPEQRLKTKVRQCRESAWRLMGSPEGRHLYDEVVELRDMLDAYLAGKLEAEVIDDRDNDIPF